MARRHALARRYNLGHKLGRRRTRQEEVDRWSANVRSWWARAEQEAPHELRAYRCATSRTKRRAALKRLEEALR